MLNGINKINKSNQRKNKIEVNRKPIELKCHQIDLISIKQLLGELMEPVYQTIFKPPLGNCEQACIASILELELDEVPNFREIDGGRWGSESMMLGEQALIEFLKPFDLYPLHFRIDEQIEDWKPQGYHFIQGLSPRTRHLPKEKRYHHLIVGYNGKPVHDPLPDGNCQLDSLAYWTLFVKRFERK